MKTKTLLTAVLLLFVGVSLVEMVLKRVRANSAEAGPTEQLALANGDNSQSPSPPSGAVIVYYCHNNERCENCRNYEAYAHETVRQDFAKQLADGRLQWRVVNFDQPQHKHFDANYQLGGIPTLVFVRINSGKQTEWKALGDGLMLIATEPKATFTDYVKKELQAFLDQEK